jgi:hypothetical protein
MDLIKSKACYAILFIRKKKPLFNLAIFCFIRNDETNLSVATISKPLAAGEYVCVYNYRGLSKTELSLKKNTKCFVFEKNLNGWWFVDAGPEGQGYVPQCVLKPLNDTTAQNQPIINEERMF